MTENSKQSFSFRIETLGCKVNQFESAAVAGILTARGHTEADAGQPCSVVIVNTCAVTGEASRKSRQLARRMLSEHPGAALAVCGCSAEPEWARELGAILIAGSADRRGFVDNLTALIEGGGQRTAGKIAEPRAFEPLPAAVSGRTRAVIKIQDGCDSFCAYCVIPYARGRSRSMPLADIAAQSRELHGRGFREIVVAGIEISSYGREPAPTNTLPGTALLDALRVISENAPGTRIRLSSLEPSSVATEFTAALREIPGICPHFHLSLQSGCDATLKRMRRKYDTARFYGAVNLLRGAFPNCGVTGDLIAGFPGETDGEFSDTLEFVKKCEFSGLHVFPYSKRPGTLAAKMPGHLPNAVKRERARAVRAAAAESREAFLRAQAGRVLDVLFETEKDGRSTGHAGNYCVVSVAGTGLRSEVRDVIVEGADNGALRGRLAVG